MKTTGTVNKIIVCTLLLVLASSNTHAATINFSGHLDFIETDNGGGIYSGTPLGTIFSGHIDDATANGQISNGIKLTLFDCCISAGGLSISNDLSLSADYAALLNHLTGSSMYSAGDLIDVVDIERDTTTPGNGRIEVGLSYIFGSSAFKARFLIFRWSFTVCEMSSQCFSMRSV